jgi:DNA-binding IclR family transcriptional regulator
VEYNPSGVGVIDKAVLLLKISTEGASLAELAERAGLPRATTHRLVSALEHHRMMIKDHTGKWRPGPQLAEWSRPSSDSIIAAAGPILAGLRDRTGESAQLFLRRGEERVCVSVSERASGLRDTVPLGAALPMTAGSAAQVLLAWEPPEIVVRYLTKSRFSGRTLAEVRKRGWAQSVGEREAGVASVSAPVRRGGRIVAAISISGPIQRLGRRPGDRHANAVVRAAGNLSSD